MKVSKLGRPLTSSLPAGSASAEAMERVGVAGGVSGDCVEPHWITCAAWLAK